jgi:hypothetical protein
MGRSSLRHTREIQGIDSAGQTPAEFGEKYNNRLDASGAPVGNPSGPTAVVFSGTVGDQVPNPEVFFSLNTGQHFAGSDTPFVYTITAGTLPSGLTLDAATGVISGTPDTVETQAGITVTATDVSTDTAVTNAFELDVVLADFVVFYGGPVPDDVGNDSVAYSLDLSAYFSGGDTPLVYTLTGGTLPSQLTLGSGTGIIDGTPDTVETQAGIIITCTDASTDFAVTNAFEIDIQA